MPLHFLQVEVILSSTVPNRVATKIVCAKICGHSKYMEHKVAPHPPSPPTHLGGRGGGVTGGDFVPTREGGKPDLDDWLDRQKMSTTRRGGGGAYCAPNYRG